MKRIVIDCDPGIDDAQAIMMAYMHPETEIEAITTVSGNVNVRYTTANALKILDILDAKSIPVFAGASSALVTPGDDASYFHGKDGLGDINLPESDRIVEKVPASLALIKLAKEKPVELSLIAIGPLTNLAIALRLEPDLPSYYKELVIMGGAYLGKGNTKNFPAEFNIYSDPEAASIVFENWPMFTMVTWETTLSHGIPFETMERFCKYENPRSLLIKKLNYRSAAYIKKLFNTNVSYIADPLAMAVLIEPEIILESIEKYVQIECIGRLTRGMTVVDWSGVSQRNANVKIIQKVDMDRFVILMRSIFE